MKIFFILICIFSLTSCKKNPKTETEFYYAEMTKVYGYNIQTKQIEAFEMEYVIQDYIDVFSLYTIHQNYLPICYRSFGTANVGLIEAVVEDGVVGYHVDNYIYLTTDLDIFTSLLKKMNADLGYLDTKILLNDKQIA